MTIKSKSGAGGVFFKLALMSGVAMLASACSYDLMGPDGSGIAEWEKPFVANEKPAEDAYAVGKTHYKKGLYGLALKNFHTSLSHKPKSVETLNAVAATYDKLGRFDLSRRYYARALALDPESPQTLNNIGYSFVMQKDYVSARAYFDRAHKAGGNASTQSAVGANLSALDNAEGRGNPSSQLAGAPVEATFAVPVNASAATPKMLSHNVPVVKNGEMVQLVAVVEDSPKVNVEDTRKVAVVAVSPRKIRNTRMVQRPVLAHADAPLSAPVTRVEMETVALSEPVFITAEPVALPKIPAKDPAPTEQPAVLAKLDAPVAIKPEPVVLPKVLAKEPAPASEPVVLAKLAAPVSHSTSVAHSEKMSRPATRSKPMANLSEPVIEISNGAGRRFLAARTRDYFNTQGVDKVRLTNADHFSYEKTAVFYREGYADQARAITRMFPMPVAMHRVDEQRSEIRVRLGADSLEFDGRMQTIRSAGS